MTSQTLYRDHLERLHTVLAGAIEHAGANGVRLDGVVLHAGKAFTYYQDDRQAPHRPTPHFQRWVPLAGEDHVVLVRPGHRPIVFQVTPPDFWYDHESAPPSYWQDEVDLVEVASLTDAARALPSLERCAFVGGDLEAAATLGIPLELVEPSELMLPLTWARASKTDHEVELISAAALDAAAGHRAARDEFLAGASEDKVYRTYLEASNQLEIASPFEGIIAFDNKCAILHYQHKRGPEAAPGTVLLVDAGAACDGYASDLTRTWVNDAVDPVFAQLLQGVDRLEQELVAMVRPDRPYLEIHLAAHAKVATLLVEVGIARASVEETLASGLTRTFLPHGIGHHLGLQVHDVGGHQASPAGGVTPPPDEHPFLRNTRTLEPGHVVTIEPGIYFIPMLLAELQASPAGSLVDWQLVERLTPHGGIRIEDDVLCTTGGYRDLSRPLLEGPTGS